MVCAVAVMLSAQISSMSFRAAAQTKYEVRAGIAGVPLGVFLADPSSFFSKYDMDPRFYYSHDRYADTRSDLFSFGTLTLDAFLQLTPRSAVGLGMGLDLLFGSVRDGYTGEPKGRQHAFGISLWPEYRLTWNPESVVRAYVSVALGAGCYHGVESLGKWSYIPVIQFVPLGLSVGRGPVSWFLEMDFGTLTMGGRTGAAWRF